MIELGALVTDKVTGFKGRALARMECLYEATSYHVYPTTLNSDGDIIKSVWFEEGRLSVDAEVGKLVGFYTIRGEVHEAA
jgi:hypothetical protein